MQVIEQKEDGKRLSRVMPGLYAERSNGMLYAVVADGQGKIGRVFSGEWQLHGVCKLYEHEVTSLYRDKTFWFMRPGWTVNTLGFTLTLTDSTLWPSLLSKGDIYKRRLKRLPRHRHEAHINDGVLVVARRR